MTLDPDTLAAHLRTVRTLRDSAIMRRDAEMWAVERLDELIADLSTDPAERVETPSATEPSGVAGELLHSQAPGFKAGSDLGENALAGEGAREGAPAHLPAGTIRVCPHSDARCHEPDPCPYSCARGWYNGTKVLAAYTPPPRPPRASASDLVERLRREQARLDTGKYVERSNTRDQAADRIVALEAEIASLRNALQAYVEKERDYMTRNSLGDPEQQRTVKQAVAALKARGEP